MQFGVGLPDRAAVLGLRDRLAADGVELAWDCAAWAPSGAGYWAGNARRPSTVDHAPAPLDRRREGLVEGVPSPTAKFGVGIGDAPDAARSPLVDYRGMPTAELVTTHGELLLEEDGVRGVSQENVDVVRRAFDAIGRRDIDALLTLYDARIEFLPLTGTRVESGGYAGHAGVRDYFEETAEVWEEMRPYAEALRSVGEHVVVIGSCAVRGRGSGAECDDPMAWVITVRRGKIIRHRGYPTGEEALDAVGLRK